ncbi:hypothetical protein HanIR_Chr10g0483181 [Helianthus annuus]|nr:hypothetical protein HanIR_Chr10g0483181 [Helianthus annuus]
MIDRDSWTCILFFWEQSIGIIPRFDRVSTIIDVVPCHVMCIICTHVYIDNMMVLKFDLYHIHLLGSNSHQPRELAYK